jgi:hypothetical protein
MDVLELEEVKSQHTAGKPIGWLEVPYWTGLAEPTG